MEKARTLKVSEIRERYYYLRRSESSGVHRCGVVYLMDAGVAMARGVSLCNKLDAFSPTCGIQKAKGRAVKALTHGENSGKVRRLEAWEKLLGTGIIYKSEFGPILTKFEREILTERIAE